MTDINASPQDSIWPLPKFYFSVDIGTQTNIMFQEVSGLDTESQIIEYRHGDDATFSTVKMPGVQKFSNVIMKKGIFKGDSSFWDWFSQIKMNTIKRETVTIKLLDESGNPTMIWTLANAWPTKITGTDLKSSGNEVAIEALEIAHEGITIGNS
ncbi:MAG: phage tail protein [Mucilaginibacter sp.]|nr:phage tail protein [Mucilaginibacter sp.]